jgi:hypothetical protein
MDTRTPSPGPSLNGSQTSRDADAKQDLSSEVALLSTKLVNAINYQTSLDDSLQQTRHELEQSRQQCHALSTENDRITAMITDGILLKKSVVEENMSRLRSELAAERAAREAAEKAKKQTEGEVENLTTELFEEANAMVAVARKDVEAMERKNQQLKEQLQDMEMVMASQQDQLREMKESMEKAQAEASYSRDPSMPTTPIATSGAAFEALHHMVSNNASNPDQAPDHPLHFAHLVTPILRHDTAAYNEFHDLLTLARRSGAHSRTNSNSVNSNASPSQTHAPPGATTTSPVMPGGFSFSSNSSPSSSTFGGNAAIPPLKDSRFYKRILSEDLEPTLRLDIAPGLSFLSRRTVLASLLNGTLAVEVFPPNKHYYACALCGESRRTEPHVRKHHFRTSEDDTAPKPLCDYCLGRLRSTCDFIAFLRMVREGHWKCDGEEDQKAAWEESVRLRERMFWSRLGGGVIPSFQHLLNTTKNLPPPTPSSVAGGAKSQRHSLGSIPEKSPTDDAAAAVAEEPLPLQSPAPDEQADETEFITPPSSTHPTPLETIPDVTPAAALDLDASSSSPLSSSKDQPSPSPTPLKAEPLKSSSTSILTSRPTTPSLLNHNRQRSLSPTKIPSMTSTTLKKSPSSLSLAAPELQPPASSSSSLTATAASAAASRPSSSASNRSISSNKAGGASSVLARVRAMEKEAEAKSRPGTPAGGEGRRPSAS